jgi:threonine synthase
MSALSWPGVYAHYRAFLPPIADEHIVTLLEGNTPLVRARRLEERFGTCPVSSI